MIVLLTARGQGRMLAGLQPTEHRFPVPKIRPMSYDRLFRAFRVPRATYIFADIERLLPWELQVASDFYRMLTAEGIRCLNDPASALSRFELLRVLEARGINPFRAYRADDAPRPARFPVYVRSESDHGAPRTNLLESQSELDAALARLRAGGTPLRGLIVVEFSPAPWAPGLWHKWGSFRVGARYSVDHVAVENKWLVKYGLWEHLTDAVVEDEHDAVRANRFEADLRPAFEIAGIDYGRADHATVDGRTVFYEINTNPYVGPLVADRKPRRHETQLIARRRLAEAFSEIDTPSGGRIAVAPSRLWPRWRAFRPGLLPPRRP